MRAFWFAVLSLVLVPLSAGAQDDAAPPPVPADAVVVDETQPNEDIIRIKAGAYIVDLSDFDMNKQSYQARLWAWFVHDQKDYNAVDSVEFIGARSTSKEYPTVDTLDDGRTIESIRYTLDMRHEWNGTFYPFDTQRLKIEIEDSANPSSMLKFEPDTIDSKVAPNISLPGWRVAKFEATERDFAYNTNFGWPVTVDDPADEPYSRQTYEITLKRDGWGVFLGSFATTILGFFLTLVMYLVAPHQLEVRIGLVLASLFGVVGDRYNLAATLPPPTGPTLADGIAATTLLALLAAVLISVKTFNAYKAGEDEEDLAHKNLNAAKTSFMLWIVVNGSMIAWAIDKG